MRQAAGIARGVRRASASPRVLMLASVLASLGMILLWGIMLIEMRRDARHRTDQAASNVLQAIAGDIARNIELFDLSLQVRSRV